MNWKFEDSGFHRGAWNMEYDEACAKSVLKGISSPTLRVYGWNPPALSLGWSQSVDDVDISKAARDGIDIVRRPTGGRAILHSEELTYSVVMPSLGKNIMKVYDDLSRALVCGLRKLCAEVKLEKNQPHFPTEYEKASAAACFTSMARFEIHIDGKKLVGSAQRRYADADGNEVVLQHGSILLGNDHCRIAEFLRMSEDEKALLRRALDERTIDLRSSLGRSVDYQEVAQAVRSGFEESWGITFGAPSVRADSLAVTV